MPNELQVIISVLTAGQPEDVNETYLQHKLDLSPDDFVQRYQSFSHLLKIGSLYCYQTLQAELEIVWQLATDTLHKLFYSLTVLQRPENQKRRRYLDLAEHSLPDFARDLRTKIKAFVEDHFYRLLVKAQEEGLVHATLSSTDTAHQLLDRNATALWNAIQNDTKTYWLDEVVLELWPSIQQFCTPKGQQFMIAALPPSSPRTLNHYSS